MKFQWICFFCAPFLLFGLSSDAGEWEATRQAFVKPPLATHSRPLWFWNSVPSQDETARQVKACKDAGYAGLAVLPAFGQDKMKFMSPEFLEQYRFTADAAKENGLKLCLYDEYWFPSGSAGGLLREQFPQHLCKRLDRVEKNVENGESVELDVPDGVLMGAVAMNLKTYNRKNITSDIQDGKLRWKPDENDRDPYKVMIFVCVLDGERDLVDYLEPESVKAFISLTYAKYQQAMPEHFGTTIDSAFYDEPMLYTPGKGRAWTPKYNEYFEKRFGYDPVPLYPAMFMDIGKETASARNALFGFRATLFSEGFVKTIVDWLKPYNMPLTGHLDQEEVVNPTGVGGDAIKFFEYQPIPGLDQIFQYGRGSCMYKLVSSAAINYDRHLVMTEVYGATANMPLDNLYKEAMDQAVKGVNMFVPHAVWYDSKGERTMPPDLSPRDAKYGPALPAYNDYIGRLQLILQKPGSSVADIAVLYPIESLQATYHFNGPLDAYVGGINSDRDNYMRIGEHLTFQERRDFHYIHPETLLKCKIEKPSGVKHPVLTLPNTINPNSYKILLLPTMEVIGLETLRKAHEFYKAGGTVVCVGQLPKNAVETGEENQAEFEKLLANTFGGDAVQKSRSDDSPESPTGIVMKPKFGGTAHFLHTDPTQPLTLSFAPNPVDVKFIRAKKLPESSPTGSFAYLHRIIDGRNVYFFSNSTTEKVETSVSFRGVEQGRYELWNPHDGTIREAEVQQFDERGTVSVPLKLGPVESVFLIEKE